MRKTFTSLLSVLLLVFLGGHALAKPPRVLWKSSSFKVTGQLIRSNLYLSHTNLTDFPLGFRCRFVSVDKSGHKHRLSTFGDLNPDEVWGTKFRHQIALPTGAKCAVTPDTDFTTLWKADTFEVLAKQHTNPDGSPQVDLSFFNTTNQDLHVNCSWWTSNLTNLMYPGIWSSDLAPYGESGLGLGGVDLAHLLNLVCTEYQDGVPVPISIPSVLGVPYNSATFIVTGQVYGDNNYGQLLAVNLLNLSIQFSCTWTVTYPDGTTHSESWTQSLYGYGISSFGTTVPATMSCSVTTTP